MNNYEIRIAVESDLAEILELSREGFSYEWQFDSTMDRTWPDKREATEYFRSCILDNSNLAVVAVKEARLIGFLTAGFTEASFYRSVDKVVELGSMVVTESERSHGIGRSLVMKFFDWCGSERATRVRVEASTANIRAIGFYKKCGFADYSSTLEMEIGPGKSRP